MRQLSSRLASQPPVQAGPEHRTHGGDAAKPTPSRATLQPIDVVRLLAIVHAPDADPERVAYAEDRLLRAFLPWIAELTHIFLVEAGGANTSAETEDARESIFTAAQLGFLAGVRRFRAERADSPVPERVCGLFRATARQNVRKEVRGAFMAHMSGLSPEVAAKLRKYAAIRLALEAAGKPADGSAIATVLVERGELTTRYSLAHHAKQIEALLAAPKLTNAAADYQAGDATPHDHELHGGHPHPDARVESVPSVDDRLVQAETAAAVRESLRALADPAIRVVLGLHFGVPLHADEQHDQPGMTLSEIAGAMGRPVSWVRACLAQGLTDLRTSVRVA